MISLNQKIEVNFILYIAIEKYENIIYYNIFWLAKLSLSDQSFPQKLHGIKMHKKGEGLKSQGM
jgi:hypothetical protein